MRTILSAAALCALAGVAHAHATFEVSEAPVNSTYKAVLRVPHGCEGEATLKVRVRIPEGVIAVKPQPKAGWTLDTVKGPYAQPYTLWGSTVTEGVVEIVWTGELLDEHYDEFVFRGRLTDALPVGEVLYIPTVQECATKAERWIEIPAAGQNADDLAYPAPGVTILPASAQ
ncbi:YcnI family protein [Rubrimonas cliftonensis]|uniref:Uncharacterized protein YcnI n=1 Tax=Rubrimonas cliftonensis TaxID=89524 RepID=A0A1H4EYM1_9RHOB|nr:DUF1775 domain-containing protein [Rubrimonas cliftonensis]SEA90081.1 Uncharacterized protein YcnI [Rubrimonas cliftonensis]